MAHVNVLSLLCLVLLCGAATARSLVETHPVNAEAGEELLAGEGHRRQLKQSDPSIGIGGGFIVDINPGVPCNDYNRDAGTPPNKQFRQGLQNVALAAARLCGIHDEAQVIAWISTKCMGNLKTKLARSIYIEYQTKLFVDSNQQRCLGTLLPAEIGNGHYASNYVNPALTALGTGYGKWVITAPRSDPVR